MRRASACLLLLLCAVPAAAVEVNRIVLRVNDKIFTLHDYLEQREARVRAIQGTDVDAQTRQELLASAGENVLRDAFDDLLLMSRADQLRIEISEQELADSIARTRQQVGVGSDEEFVMALQQSGVTLDEFRERTRHDLTVREVMSQEVGPRVRLEEEDRRRYYQAHQQEFIQPERRRLQEVVVLETSGRSAQDLSRIADEMRAKLAAAEDLGAVVADSSSAGRTSGLIDLGWIARGDLDEALERAAWALAPGELSEPVPGRGGLHIVRLVEIQEQSVRPFADVENEIDDRERERLFDEEVEEYFRELESKSYVLVMAPPEAAGFRTRAEAGSRRGIIQGLDEIEGDELETLVPSPEEIESAEPEGSVDPSDG